MLTTAEAITEHMVSQKPGGNGALGRLDTLLSSFEQVDVVGGSVPLLRMPPSSRIDPVDYDVTRRFMERVVAAGEIEGANIFASGPPVFKEFYDARESGKAIVMLQNPPVGEDPTGWDERVGYTEAARSVVERAELVASILTEYAKDLLERDPDRRVNILSIACGWGRLPLDVMTAIDNIPPNNPPKGFFVDLDPEAITACQNEALLRNMRQRIALQETNVWDFFPTLQRAHQGENDLVESTGFTDYLKNPWVTRLFRAGYDLVSQDGIVVVTNIVSDREDEYLKIVWEQGRRRMYRRTPEELANFALDAGFSAKRTILILDSTATMCTVVAGP